jgi:CO/xanthine dehydrogenase FAD-binding subunit
MARERTYDVAPILSSLGSTLIFATKDGESSSPVEDVLKVDPGRAGLGPLCTAIDIPTHPRTAISYCRAFKPVATVAVTVTDEGDGSVKARVAVDCAFPSLVVGSAQFVCRDESQARKTSEEAAETYITTLPDPLDDHAASADYRHRLVRVLVRKELEQAVSSLLGSKGV